MTFKTSEKGKCGNVIPEKQLPMGIRICHDEACLRKQTPNKVYWVWTHCYLKGQEHG